MAKKIDLTAAQMRGAGSCSDFTEADIFVDLAYIKKEELNNEPVWSIYNFQGEKMGYASSREMAFAVARQNEYVGNSVH